MQYTEVCGYGRQLFYNHIPILNHRMLLLTSALTVIIVTFVKQFESNFHRKKKCIELFFLLRTFHVYVSLTSIHIIPYLLENFRFHFDFKNITFKINK